ncbi:hypothetical protein BREVNS_2404 [Brevinematales bacterium NS]|nr:hypothetical protein BREVNS_2404 [Brevinematales bacterium NS]
MWRWKLKAQGLVFVVAFFIFSLISSFLLSLGLHERFSVLAFSQKDCT